MTAAVGDINRGTNGDRLSRVRGPPPRAWRGGSDLTREQPGPRVRVGVPTAPPSSGFIIWGGDFALENVAAVIEAVPKAEM